MNQESIKVKDRECNSEDGWWSRGLNNLWWISKVMDRDMMDKAMLLGCWRRAVCIHNPNLTLTCC